MNEYSAKNIKILRGLDPVKKRPGMFIGGTDKSGLHHLIWEIIDNSIDESVAGFCNKINVTLTKDNEIEVEDNGRGIPVEIHEQTKISAVETILTTLHSGGKFDNETYKTSGGLHGVGASVVNALSDYFIIWIYRNNKIYYQKYTNGGIPEKKLEEIGKTDKKGTKIIFKPNFTVFENITFDDKIIKERLKELSFLNSNLKITFENKKSNQINTFYYKNGLIDFINEYTKNSKKLFEQIIIFNGELNSIQCNMSFTYIINNKPTIWSFCNNIKTYRGGTHEEGFKTALSRAINKYAKANKLFPKNVQIISDDFRDGIFLILSIKHTNPQFEGQTKSKLGNNDAKSVIFKLVYAFLNRFFSENPEIIKLIIRYVVNTANARIAAKRLQDKIKNTTTYKTSTLPGKLADCATKNLFDREIFIVEGDSAGGSAKMARNRENQAILPLKGKIINCQKENKIRVLKNDEIKSIITAIGCGIIDAPTFNMKEFNIDDRRYNKIIIMTDADVDGSHINILILTFLINYMPDLITKGYVYLALPPLYKVFFSSNKFQYFFDDKNYNSFIEKNPNIKIKQTQRYKGLGEMNPEQLWETTMDPTKRKILKIQIKDFEKTLNNFERLMGSKTVSERRNFIIENFIIK